MDYREALKKVQGMKPREMYMAISISYDNRIVLPHKDGVALLMALEHAEQMKDPYSGKASITALEKDKITVTLMSREEYERYKIASLLGVSIDDVKTMEMTDATTAQAAPSAPSTNGPGTPPPPLTSP